MNIAVREQTTCGNWNLKESAKKDNWAGLSEFKQIQIRRRFIPRRTSEERLNEAGMRRHETNTTKHNLNSAVSA